MYKLKIKILIALFLISGCGGGSSSSNIEKRPQLNKNNIISTVNQEVELSESQFSDGVVIENVTIATQTDNDVDTVATTISEGTEFVDDKEETITTPPTVAIAQQESSEDVVKEGEVTTKSVVKTELKLVDKDGNKMIPSKPVEIVMKAPSGTKPGDEIRVDIPTGTTTNKEAVSEKLVFVVVGADGNVYVKIVPQIFRNLTVIVIIIERTSPPTPITGGSGSN
jgi:hypothetical protein